jgi:hypothetical protein
MILLDFVIFQDFINVVRKIFQNIKQHEKGSVIKV